MSMMSTSKTIYLHPAAYEKLLKLDDGLLPSPTPDTALMAFGSVSFVVDKYMPSMMPRQVRKPRSKKKRIRKKWAMNPMNWRDESVAYLIDTSKPFLRPQRISFTVPSVPPLRLTVERPEAL